MKLIDIKTLISMKSFFGGCSVGGDDNDANITHIDLFDFYHKGRDHPIELYKKNIHIIGHIAGPSGSGKTYLGEQLQKKYPSIVVKDLDELLDGVKYTPERMYILRDRMQKFVYKNFNKPILFVGYNYEDNTFIDIPGTKQFIDISVDTLMQQYLSRSKKISHKITKQHILDLINVNAKDKQYYLSKGYRSTTGENIYDDMSSVDIPNHLWKIKHSRNGPIIHISGRSGTGKTTLVNNLTSKGIYCIDTDIIDDEISSQLSPLVRQEKILEEFDKTLKMQPENKSVFIGISIVFDGIADYTFYIDLDIIENYRRLNKRNIENLCNNKQKIYDDFLNLESPINEYGKVRTNVVFIKYKIRGPILQPIKQYEQFANMQIRRFIADGYILLNGNDIDQTIRSIS